MSRSHAALYTQIEVYTELWWNMPRCIASGDANSASNYFRAFTSRLRDYNRDQLIFTIWMEIESLENLVKNVLCLVSPSPQHSAEADDALGRRRIREPPSLAPRNTTCMILSFRLYESALGCRRLDSRLSLPFRRIPLPTSPPIEFSSLPQNPTDLKPSSPTI